MIAEICFRDEIIVIIRYEVSLKVAIIQEMHKMVLIVVSCCARRRSTNNALCHGKFLVSHTRTCPLILVLLRFSASSR